MPDQKVWDRREVCKLRIFETIHGWCRWRGLKLARDCFCIQGLLPQVITKPPAAHTAERSQTGWSFGGTDSQLLHKPRMPKGHEHTDLETGSDSVEKQAVKWKKHAMPMDRNAGESLVLSTNKQMPQGRTFGSTPMNCRWSEPHGPMRSQCFGNKKSIRGWLGNATRFARNH